MTEDRWRMQKWGLISLAFSCRCDSILVEVSEVEEERPSVRDVASVPFQTVRIAPLHLALCRFVVTEEWIKDVKMAFNPEQMIHFESYSSTEMQPKVDVLVKILWSRLQNHIRSRVFFCALSSTYSHTWIHDTNLAPTNIFARMQSTIF